ncbi:MAG: hypothetical protein E6936_10425 [Clostridium perfringens]|nr:hypothetical protein [Clostridium perfringens]
MWKKVLGISLVILIIGLFTIFSPYIYTEYQISNAIKKTPLNQEIKQYKRTGFKGSTIIVDVTDSFGDLSNKVKYNEIEDMNNAVRSIIYNNFISGKKNEDEIYSKFNRENKVIVNLGSDNYKFQNKILTLNGKEIYKFKAPKIDESKHEYIGNEIYNPKENKIQKKALTNDEEIEVRVLTKKLIKDNLKNPSGAKFCGYDELHINQEENGTFLVTGWVDATNSFGAVLRNDFQVTFERRNGHMFGSDVQIFEN